jgi:hypothetical protein
MGQPGNNFITTYKICQINPGSLRSEIFSRGQGRYLPDNRTRNLLEMSNLLIFIMVYLPENRTRNGAEKVAKG